MPDSKIVRLYAPIVPEDPDPSVDTLLGTDNDVSSGSFSISISPGSGVYYVYAVAEDGAGHKSGPSDVIQFELTG